jgi:hypothetical protein
LLSEESRSAAIAALNGQTLLGERGSHGTYTINGRVSAGLGGSRLLPTRDGGWFALTLIRDADRELLPALLGDGSLDIHDDASVAAHIARHDVADLLARGRVLGLPVASMGETPLSPPVETMTTGQRRVRTPDRRPLVVDLSAIWAGPLAGHLFHLMGMRVAKVESSGRPDLIRRDDPATFDLINQGKASLLVDFADEAHKAALVRLIREADIVIESSRPRALRHLGVDADMLVREVPGLVWLSVTGHGATGEAADWVGIGNDCGVAGGLTRAMADASGEIGYVGDAIADPLTGITAALAGWRALRSGTAQRIGLSMSAICARALREERAFDEGRLDTELRVWANAVGRPFPRVPRRPQTAPVRQLGADTAEWLPELAGC